ncbi:MAG TPA: lipopolysaccharide heptosyltransferase II [Bacteroidota bacterium]|nr:lipopolysaccharide heptosyltransferase II [Bacteroidota bacterium]
MMGAGTKIVIFQTAFLGDVILTLPVAQALHRAYPHATIDLVTTPQAAGLVKNHPAINSVIPYDKKRSQTGVSGIIEIVSTLRRRSYDIAIVPHRSVRSASIIRLAGIPMRIGFTSSSFRWAYTHRIPYVASRHEVERNLSLLSALNVVVAEKEIPAVYPDANDVRAVEKFLFEQEVIGSERCIALAPGSVWNTKRWLPERFTGLAHALAHDGWAVFLIGGSEDEQLCRSIAAEASHKNIFLTAGKFSLLESAELLRRCKVLVSNDSAPLHLSVAVGTPVVAVFGATVPEFGFAPYGDINAVVEIKGLACRPCGIHGGHECPIGTFDCMKRIDVNGVLAAIHKVVTEYSSKNY